MTSRSAQVLVDWSCDHTWTDDFDGHYDGESAIMWDGENFSCVFCDTVFVPTTSSSEGETK